LLSDYMIDQSRFPSFYIYLTIELQNNRWKSDKP
jgi:hypothetical protein